MRMDLKLVEIVVKCKNFFKMILCKSLIKLKLKLKSNFQAKYKNNFHC